MRNNFRILCVAAVIAVVFNLSAACEEEEVPKIQMAILLDTSGSMSGLIDQARSELWKIVNEFVTMKSNGMIPQLEVALFEYGKSTLPSDEGYLRMILSLTTDLDKVSQELFALTTNGGSEYCGMVIRDAVHDLAWSDNKRDLKTIFIAGNEPFTQGNVDYHEPCRAAITKGIVVNTIFCGNHEEGVKTCWQDGALLAEGSYISIDHNMAVAHIEAPQDKKISRLGEELNKTYIPFGALGAEGVSNQAAQDANAAGVGTGVLAQRARTKASSQYSNYHWDLVDAVTGSKVELEEVKTEDLPEEMKEMSIEAKSAFIAAKAEDRKKIQSEIIKLDQERREFVAEKRKEMAVSENGTFDSAVIESIRRMAKQRNMTVDTP